LAGAFEVHSKLCETEEKIKNHAKILLQEAENSTKKYNNFLKNML